MSCLYIVESPTNGLSKFGYSQYPEERFKNICNVPIAGVDIGGIMPPLYLRYIFSDLTNAYGMEQYIHYTLLDPYHYCGLEWYNLSSETMKTMVVGWMDYHRIPHKLTAIPDSFSENYHATFYKNKVYKIARELYYLKHKGQWLVLDHSDNEINKMKSLHNKARIENLIEQQEFIESLGVLQQ